MAGFREFVTGEVLTAANVDDFLMKQSVQKYADAAARDAALGTAVAGGNALREGMVAWLDDTNSVIAYDGTAWNPVGAEPPAGIGSNVVSATKTDTQSTTSESLVDVSDLSVTITPTSATSKVLVLVTVLFGQSIQGATFTLTDGSNNNLIVPSVSKTTSDGFLREFNNNAGIMRNANLALLHSPATTSAFTYKVRFRTTNSGGALFVNRDPNNDAAGVSTITAIEVAA